MTSPKITLATSWLDGCSGCHMSLLDLDQRLIELAASVDFVYCPLVDCKTLPDQVDVGILEGAVSSQEDLDKARAFRQSAKFLISLGDCAVTGNVPALRNSHPLEKVLHRAFIENVQTQPQIPQDGLPQLMPVVRPIHHVVAVDLHVPGCPPTADVIWSVLGQLLRGEMPDISKETRFGA